MSVFYVINLNSDGAITQISRALGPLLFEDPDEAAEQIGLFAIGLVTEGVQAPFLLLPPGQNRNPLWRVERDGQVVSAWAIEPMINDGDAIFAGGAVIPEAH